MEDDNGSVWRFRFIHYNNSLHDPGGTRDEYRITWMTAFFRAIGATAGDTVVLSGEPGTSRYRISVRKFSPAPEADPSVPVRIRLRGWKRVY
jgi:hypothetical protein